MIPLARGNSRLLPVIQEDEHADLTLVGSIEVDVNVVEGRRGQPIIDRITVHCLPPQDEVELGLTQTRSFVIQDFEEDEEEEGYELPPTLLEELTGHFLNCATCACDTSYPKSVLRTSKFGDYTSASPMNLSVSFSQLEIREFPMTLGNHPSATSGPPVMLDSVPLSELRTVPVDEYEALRGPRRERKQLKLSYRTRKSVLEEERGFSTEEVNQAWAEALTIRKQRQETLRRGLLLQTLDDVYESACRKVSRFAEAIGL